MSKGDAPDDWARTRLDSIADVRLGRQRSPNRAFGPNMVPYLRAANVTWRGVDLSDVKEMDFSPAEVETYRLKTGDILLAEASGSPFEVGKPALYVDGAHTHCFQNTLIRVRATADLTRFLHLHFLADVLLGRFAAAARGVGIQHLGAEALSGWEVVLPPVGEQGRIADATDSYFARIQYALNSLEGARAKLKSYRASVLKAAVEGRLVPSEASFARCEKRIYEPAEALLARILTQRRRRWEEAELARFKATGKTPNDDKWKVNYEEPVALDGSRLPQLPEGWCWASVEQLGLIASGQTPSGITEACSAKGDVPWFRVGDMNARGNERYMVNAKDFLTHAQVAALRLHVRPVGTIIFPKRGGAIATNKKRLLPRPSAYDMNTMGVVPIAEVQEYLWLWFLNLDLGKLSDGSNVPQINHDDISMLAVALPPVAEGHRICDEVERLFSCSDNSLEQVMLALRRCARLRKGILKWAFEGKLVDQDPTDEPAEKLLARIRAERAAFAPTKKSRSGRAKGAA